MMVMAFGSYWRKVTPRSNRQIRNNILKQFEANPEMRNAIEYKKMNDRPDNAEDFRIPINAIVALTTRAVMVDFGDKKEWLPLSIVKYGMVGVQRVCDMPEWLARKHKLI